jgi:regulator of cell morphogenesis and NO signaling
VAVEHPLATRVLALASDLDPHLIKEEQVLFPMIRAGHGASAGDPIAGMEMEHEAVGGMLRRLRELTDDYRIPEGACNTWRALWVGLEALEHDLHDHIHLENNILHTRVLGTRE